MWSNFNYKYNKTPIYRVPIYRAPRFTDHFSLPPRGPVNRGFTVCAYKTNCHCLDFGINFVYNFSLFIVSKKKSSHYFSPTSKKKVTVHSQKTQADLKTLANCYSLQQCFSHPLLMRLRI